MIDQYRHRFEMIYRSNSSLVYRIFLLILIMGMHAEYQFGSFGFFRSNMQYSTVEFVIGFAILFLCGYIIYERISPKELFKEKVLFFILLSFCLSLLLSTVFATYKVEAVKYDIRIVSNIALFYLFLQFLFKEKLTRMSLIVVNVVGIIITSVGVMEFFRIGWIQEFLIQNQWGIGSRPASVTSVFIHNNVFGNYFVLLIFVTLGQLKNMSGRPYKILLWFCLALFVLNVVFSLSRSAWVAFICAAGLCIWLKRKDKILFTRAIIIASVFAVVLIAIPAAKQRIVKTVATAKKGQIDRASGRRLTLERAAITIFQKYPLVGIGLNNFKNQYHEFVDMPPNDKLNSHNQYLNVLAEQGIIGFSIFMVFVAYLVRLAISNIKKGGNEFYALAIFAYMIGALFDYLWYDYSLIFMFWFVVILNLIEKRNLEIKGFRDSGIEAQLNKKRKSI